MQTLLLTILLSLFAAPAPPERLRRLDPKLQVNNSAEERVTFERTIPAAKRQNLHKYLTEHFKEPLAQIYRMPLGENLYLALVQDFEQSNNHFLLLKSAGEAVSEVNRINSDQGCMLLTPTFFVGKDRALIILSISAADGGYCGNDLLEYKGQELKYLSDIAVYDGVHGRGGFQGHSPIENLTTVELKRDTYYVTLRGRGSLYGQKDQRLARPGTPITYFYDGNEFRRASAGQRK
jgi:hypothetical protein